jgi:hypothetical protein
MKMQIVTLDTLNDFASYVSQATEVITGVALVREYEIPVFVKTGGDYLRTRAYAEVKLRNPSAPVREDYSSDEQYDYVLGEYNKLPDEEAALVKAKELVLEDLRKILMKNTHVFIELPE